MPSVEIVVYARCASFVLEHYCNNRRRVRESFKIALKDGLGQISLKEYNMAHFGCSRILHVCFVRLLEE